MPTKDIDGTYTSTYMLSTSFPSIYFETGNTITTTLRTGVYGASGTAWTVTNAGAISVTSSASSHHSGVALLGSNSSLTNDAEGTITNTGAYGAAAYLGSTGEIDNAGLIASYGDHVSAVLGITDITVTNTGTIKANNEAGDTHAAAVNLKDGGTLDNDAHSIVETYGTHVSAVELAGTGSIDNHGTLMATLNSGGYGDAVYLVNAGGSLTNESDGTISSSGYHQSAVYMKAAGTTTNFGQITSTASDAGHASGIDLGDGGTATNEAKAVIQVSGEHVVGIEAHTTAATVNNYGAINITGGDASGVYAFSAITVTNTGSIDLGKPGSSVNGGAGVNLTDGGSFDNGGSVYSYGNNLSAVYLKAGATAENSSVLTAKSNATGHVSGVYMDTGDTTFHNEAAGSVAAYGQYSAGVGVKAGGSVYNYGTISETGAKGDGNGVYFIAGGSLTNTNLISETGGSAGVWTATGADILNKAKGVISGHLAGVAAATNYFYAAGTSSALTLTNYNGAQISGDTGVFLNGASGSVVNAGTITGSTAYTYTTAKGPVNFGDGVFLGQASDSVNNETGGGITGARYGVYASGDDEAVTNAGSITGATAAVEFSGGGANKLTLQTGSSLTGDVVGSVISGATNALILQGTASAANNFDNFTTLDVQTGANWTLTGTSAIVTATIEGSLTAAAGLTSSFTLNAGSTLDLTGATFDTVTFNGQATLDAIASFGGEILSFNGADKVDITNLSNGFVQSQMISAGDTIVTVEGSNGSAQLTFVGTSFDGEFFAQPDSGSGTIVEVPCFARGTRVRTLRGEIAVEQLQVGDSVVTASGTRPIVWIGHRAIDCRRHVNPKSVQPIRVAANAFADNQPVRDLWLSSGHSVAVDGVLIPIGLLVNGHSIEQIDAAAVEYWHVELDSHDILLAEGLAAESYLDCGNRTDFANGGAFLTAHPDFLPRHWRETCLPLVLEGREIVKTKQSLLDRLLQQGVEATRDADAHILVDGRRIAPMWVRENRLAFVIPEGCESIVLRSRTFTPAYSETGNGDQRELGLCISRLSVDGENVSLESDTLCKAGWYEAEYEDGRFVRRWTAGAARLSPGVRVVVIDLASHATYLRKIEVGRVTRRA